MGSRPAACSGEGAGEAQQDGAKILPLASDARLAPSMDHDIERRPWPVALALLVKTNQRLEYSRLADVLAERGMCEPQALREALQFSSRGNSPFAEAIVSASLVSDWELSRVVAEIYNLPFVTVDTYDPDPTARDGLNKAFLIEHGLVPLNRYGQLLTVAMPGMVPAEVLALLSSDTDLTIIPVVGTVQTNRRWIERNLHQELNAALPRASKQEVEQTANEWGEIFDQANAAVLLDLHPSPENDPNN